MDAQEIFDKVSQHLLAQGEQSAEPHPKGLGVSCKYRGPRGLRCAVGCVIEDDEYDPTFENATIGDLICNRKVLGRLKPYLGLLFDLQDLHDDTEPQSWRHGLNRLAENHGLEMRA